MTTRSSVNTVVSERLHRTEVLAEVLAGHVTWGPWYYNPGNRTLVFTGEPTYSYEVDLDTMKDSASVLDWIAQVAGKTTFTVADIGHFVRALNEVLQLQAVVCPSGQDHKFKAATILRRRSGSI